MLEVVEICPSCGQIHGDRQFGLVHGEPRACPKVVLGSFPVLSVSEPDPVEEVPIRFSAARRIRDFETPAPVALGSLPFPRRAAPEPRPMRSLTAPWLPPPDLGEVL